MTLEIKDIYKETVYKSRIHGGKIAMA